MPAFPVTTFKTLTIGFEFGAKRAESRLHAEYQLAIRGENRARKSKRTGAKMVGFSDNPQTEWLDFPRPDRSVRLLREFWFDDSQGQRWTAPKGAVVDGASIPQSLWSLVGSPFTGQYRRASIVHDVACANALDFDARRAADRMFYEACLAGGCTVAEAMILYSGVRLGAEWSHLDLMTLQPKVLRPIADKRMEADFQLLTTDVLAQGETADPFQLERQVDNAMARLAQMQRY